MKKFIKMARDAFFESCKDKTKSIKAFYKEKFGIDSYDAILSYAKSLKNHKKMYQVLGDIYFYELYTKRNTDLAFQYYSRASDLGDAHSSKMLSIFHSLWLAPYSDEITGNKYLCRSASQGNKSSIEEYEDHFYPPACSYDDIALLKNRPFNKDIYNLFHFYHLDDELKESIEELIELIPNDVRKDIVKGRSDVFEETITAIYDDVSSDYQKMFGELDERQCMLASLEIAKNIFSLVDNTNGELVLSIYRKFFGENFDASIIMEKDEEELDIESEIPTPLFLARNIAIMYEVGEGTLCKGCGAKESFGLVSYLNFTPYFNLGQISTNDLDILLDCFLSHCLRGDDGKRYPLPEHTFNNNAEIATQIAIQCIFLMNKIDNPDVSDSDNAHFLIHYYFDIKEAVEKQLDHSNWSQTEWNIYRALEKRVVQAGIANKINRGISK